MIERAGRSPDSRIVLERRLPGFHPQWQSAALVTAYSGGAVSESRTASTARPLTDFPGLQREALPTLAVGPRAAARAA